MVHSLKVNRERQLQSIHSWPMYRTIYVAFIIDPPTTPPASSQSQYVNNVRLYTFTSEEIRHSRLIMLRLRQP